MHHTNRSSRSAVRSSNIDNLFVSPGGRLTIVETRLWRNAGYGPRVMRINVRRQL